MPQSHQQFIMYNPFGVLCQLQSNDAMQLRKKKFLSHLYKFPEGTMPVGRLDEKSEGLLILTTDGKLCEEINRSGVEKQYYAQVDGEITDNALQHLNLGVEIGFDGKKYLTKPSEAERLQLSPKLPMPDASLRLNQHRPSTWISLTLTEGKFRQVRKMTAAVGFPTLRLVRYRIGALTLEGLEPAKVVRLPTYFRTAF
ncbi:MAG: pseudouridine synthase [Pricia sp.]|nr:pseudouridine synthase [Pricia sp.]